jgi:uncharacterized protein YaiE (UPF0345 family)
MQQLQRQAGSRLPPDFARQVVEDAKRRRYAFGQIRLMVITGALCVVTTVSVHWVKTQSTEKQNIAAWTQVTRQIQAFEEAI